MTNTTSSKGRPRGRPRAGPALALRPSAVARRGLHEEAAARLKAMIIAGEIPPGSALPETDMSAALGISRTPLREALKRLAAEGLVALRPNRSAQVVDWRAEDVLDLFEALAGIERLAAELAARRIAPQDLDDLRRRQADLDRLHAARDMAGYFDVNQAIHRAIVAASGNRTLVEMHESLSGRAQWARLRALSADRRWAESAAEHRDLLAALEARDAERAGATAAEHVRRTGAIVAQVLATALPEAAASDRSDA